MSRRLPQRGGRIVSRDVLGVRLGRGAGWSGGRVLSRAVSRCEVRAVSAGLAGVEDRGLRRPSGWAALSPIRETAPRATGALRPGAPIAAP